MSSPVFPSQDHSFLPTVVGIGFAVIGCALAAIGIAALGAQQGWWSAGALSNFHQIGAISLMASGGCVILISLIALCIGCTNQAKTNIADDDSDTPDVIDDPHEDSQLGSAPIADDDSDIPDVIYDPLKDSQLESSPISDNPTPVEESTPDPLPSDPLPLALEDGELLKTKIQSGLNIWVETAPELQKQNRFRFATTVINFYNDVYATDLRFQSYCSAEPETAISSLPAEIGLLCKIQSLTILTQPIISSIPPEICQLTNLTKMEIRIGLTSLPSEIGQLAKLEFLNLNYNQLTSLPPEIGHLSNLKSLRLVNNQFTSVPPVCGRLSSLEKLMLDNNQIISFPTELQLLTNLEFLNLRSNNLTSLPNEIFQFPSTTTIYLQENLFSSQVIGSLQAIVNAPNYEGPIIQYSLHSMANTERQKEFTLEQHLEELAMAAGDLQVIEVKQLIIIEKNKESLHGWLSRLSSIGDYKENKRQELASMIYHAIVKAEEDATFRDAFLACIAKAGTTCGDRMALSVLKLGIRYHISQSSNDIANLAFLLGHGVWALNQLEIIATEKIKTLKLTDPIEVYLAYPIKLKKALKIPIILDSMLYFNCSELTKKDLNEAEESVRNNLSNKKAYSAFLATQDEWQKVLKEHKETEYSILCNQKEAAIEQTGFTDYETPQNNFLAALAQLTEMVLEELEFEFIKPLA